MEPKPIRLSPSDIGESQNAEVSPGNQQIIYLGPVPGDVEAGIGVIVENWHMGTDVNQPHSRGGISVVVEQIPQIEQHGSRGILSRLRRRR